MAVKHARELNYDIVARDIGQGEAIGVRHRESTVEALVQQTRALLIAGDHKHVLVELCCAPDSELPAGVIDSCVAVRVTASDDLSQKKTKVALHRLLRLCKLYEVDIDIWVAIPCTSGSPWAKVNALKGIETGDAQLTDTLIEAAVSLCRHACRNGGGIHWEWSAGNELWKGERVQSLLEHCKTIPCKVSTAAVGQTFQKKLKDPNAGVFYVKKKWRVETTSQRLADALKPYEKVPGNIPKDDFRQCCGRVCSGSSYYTPLLAELIWSALRPRPVVAMACVVPATASERVLPSGKPQMPLWCAMITRTISIKAQEGQSDKAKAAVKAEVDSHTNRGTWDISKVKEVAEWMRDERYTEVLIGRAFVIVGAKFSEETDQSDMKYKARMVYQGNNIWTRSGKTVYEIFDEVSNSPSSLAAARAAMAIGLVHRMTHLSRCHRCVLAGQARRRSEDYKLGGASARRLARQLVHGQHADSGNL